LMWKKVEIFAGKEFWWESLEPLFIRVRPCFDVIMCFGQ